MPAADSPSSRKRLIGVVVLGTCITLAAGVGAGWLIVRSPEWISDAAIGPEVPEGEVRASGDQIISALGQYKSKHGQFPPSLSALVPELLATIPPCGSAGHVWSYRSPTPSSFVLGTSGGKHTYPCMYFDSVKGTWLHDT